MRIRGRYRWEIKGPIGSINHQWGGRKTPTDGSHFIKKWREIT